MVKFETNGIDYEMPENYQEMTLETFIRISKIQESGTEFVFQEYYLIKLLEAIVGAEPGDLDDMTIEEMANLSNKLTFLSEEPTLKKVDKIIIGDLIYAFPENFNKITAGEMISIKTLNEGKSTGDSILNLLAIILRPAKEVIDEETGKVRLVRNKFDAQNLEHRKSLFKKLPVLDCLWSVNFFFTDGNLTSTASTQDSTIEELR